MRILKQLFASFIVIGAFYGTFILEKRLAQGQQIVANSNNIVYQANQYTTFGDYVAPLESTFGISSELNMPIASLGNIGLASAGSGGTGNTTGVGFENDDGAINLNTGTTGSGEYRQLSGVNNSATARSLVLSATPQRLRILLLTSGALTQKTVVVGLGDSTTINTAYQAAGAADAVIFRIVAAGAAVNWFAVTKNGASETTTDTGVIDVLDTQRMTFEIIATTTQIQYGICTTASCIPTVLATHTTNIPNDALILIAGLMTANVSNKILTVHWLKYLTGRTNF